MTGSTASIRRAIGRDRQARHHPSVGRRLSSGKSEVRSYGQRSRPDPTQEHCRAGCCTREENPCQLRALHSGPKRRRACRAAFPFQVRNAGAHSARARLDAVVGLSHRHHAPGLRVDEGNLNAAYRFFQSAKSSGLKIIGYRALYPASPQAPKRSCLCVCDLSCRQARPRWLVWTRCLSAKRKRKRRSRRPQPPLQ